MKPLYIMLPKTSAYVKSSDGKTKWRYFLTEDDDLLKKCNTIWDKVSADIKKEFDSESVNNKVFWEPKQNLMAIKLQIFTIKISPLGSYNTCLAVTSSDSAHKKDENYYWQVFLKQCKYIEQ